MDSKQLNALISLLDDPDIEIFKTVSQKIVDLGFGIIPELELAWENSSNEIFQKRIENIISSIQFKQVKEKLEEWSKKPVNDLFEGAYWVAKYQYPNLDFYQLKEKLDAIKKNVWLELNNNLTALEKIKILNHIIFNIHGFSKNSTNYLALSNSFINTVLEEKKGNSIALAIIYGIIAQDLELPVYGVNLPQNFILAYKDEFADIPSESTDITDSILFYINPYNKGAVFGKKEIEFFLKQQSLQLEESYFAPCSNIETIIELLKTLQQSFEKLAYHEKMDDMEELINLLLK